MKQTFLTKVSYTKQFDNGTFKRVVEQYLFDGHTFIDCEANVYTHLGERIRGEFTIIKMDRLSVDSIVGQIQASYDKFFLVKQEFLSAEDALIKEKVLVIASDMDEAKQVLISKNERWDDFHPEIKSIVETKILDYFQSEQTIEE
jgi:hypothetical protein